MTVMAKKIPLAVLLLFAWISPKASEKISNSAVPARVRAAIQEYAPGAQLIEARVSADKQYRQLYDCTYFRNIHLGSIKLGARGQLVEIDEALVIDDVPAPVRRKILSETKGGLIKKIKLDALYGHAVYRVKAYYAKSTNIEISLVLTRTGRIVERKVNQGLLIFLYTSRAGSGQSAARRFGGGFPSEVVDSSTP
jgi:hypothetical protein